VGRFVIAMSVVVATLLAVPGNASGGSVEGLEVGGDVVEIEGDTVSRIDSESGDTIWEIVHASMWVTVSRDKRDVEIVEPQKADGHLYYGVYNWLMRVDPANGVIERRQMFPAPIEAIETTDGGEQLEVTVAVENHYEEGKTEVTFQYTPGLPSPQEVWNLVGLMDTWKDASYISKAINTDYVGGPPTNDKDEEIEGYPVTEAEREAAIETLRARRSQEPSNPFYDYFIGATYQEMGRTDDARAAYRRAVETEDAHWTSYLILTSFLDGARKHDLADTSFERAHRQIENLSGVPVTEWTSLPAYLLTLGWSKFTVKEAVKNNEYGRASRVLARTAETFPHLAHAPKAWRTMAEWYADAGRADLSQRFKRHAQRAEESPWRVIFNAYKTVDVTVALIIGFALAMWVACFVIGARRSRADAWWPRPTRLEIAGLGVALLAPLCLLWIQGSAAQKIRFIADRADAVALGAWASPNAEKWAERLHESDARSRLLDDIDHYSSATRRGHPSEGKRPAPELIVSAIDADTRTEAWQNMVYDGETYIMRQFGAPHLMVCLAVWMGVGIMALFVGGLVGRVGVLETIIRYGVPGGARSASVVTPVMIGLAITAVISISYGADNILHRLARPAFGKYFGVGPIYENTHTPSSALRWWVSLAVVGVAHVVTLYVDWWGE
jgi:tetratricopeptide (TPR) repeat protein